MTEMLVGAADVFGDFLFLLEKWAFAGVVVGGIVIAVVLLARWSSR